ncbi:MAG: SirB2 family protein [Marinicella sp.]
MYPIVKQLHVILVITSITLFQFRYWRFHVGQKSPKLIFKIAPHVIDTALLISGISLAVLAHFSPLNTPWLLYKLLLLVGYILLGAIAMKRHGMIQWLSYLLATIFVLTMVLLAMYKSTWPLT